MLLLSRKFTFIIIIIIIIIHIVMHSIKNNTVKLTVYEDKRAKSIYVYNSLSHERYRNRIRAQNRILLK